MRPADGHTHPETAGLQRFSRKFDLLTRGGATVHDGRRPPTLSLEDLVHHGFTHNPALTIAVALAVGVLAQAVARHLRIPGIVLLLGAGVALGPDVLGVVRPGDLGSALGDLTGFAVAVILFDGGLNLNLRRMKAQALTIRLLLSAGVVITSLGGALAVRLALGWDWTTSLLFGTLVIVTGPTVITPLLRRIRVKRSVETILESEGVLIDAVGAVVAVVALEMVLAPGDEAAQTLAGAPMGLFGGLALGAVGGGVLALLLRSRHAVPEGFGNILTLGVVLALFQASNALIPESGIAAAIAAGFVVGNLSMPAQRDLREFKEQLTVMFIGLLFVLLAADVRVAEVIALGVPGLMVALALMFVVRPLSIAACTAKSSLSLAEKGFLAWVAPRGIVAAAVATLFNDRLSEAGSDGGGELRALVFLVIATTVLFQGATASFMARLLKVKRPSGQGYAILGAQALGRLLGRTLQEGGAQVVMMDSDPIACRETEAAGLRALFGNGLDDRILMRAAADSRRAVVAASTSESVNLLLVRKVLDEFKGPAVYAAVQAANGGVEPSMVHEEGGSVLFGDEIDVELWNVRIRRGTAALEIWRRESADCPEPPDMSNLAVPFVRQLKGRREPVHDGAALGKGAEVHWLVNRDRLDEAHAKLRGCGWLPLEPPVAEPETASPEAPA